MANRVCVILLVSTLSCSLLIFILSWSVLEYTELGLDYNAITRSINEDPYGPGRHFLGFGHSFIKFPSTVQNVQFSAQGTRPDSQPLRSRTSDGLEISLEISFQYQLQVMGIYAMYMFYGSTYDKVFVRMAMDLLTISATKHPAKDFFANRTVIAANMETALRQRFEQEQILIPLFQFQSVQLPGNSTKFEQAIRDTQVADQKIKRSKATQEMRIVEFETGVIKAQKNVEIVMQEAYAQKRGIELQNDAFVAQYNKTQILTAAGFQAVRRAFGTDVHLFLDYVKLRSLRDHPSKRTTFAIPAPDATPVSKTQ
eukprot:GEMP01038271.1.p1 GENE.GEMP01038271.1~~GEMP01038271.1.p1  ORF type:complete len:312 (+),score=39.68 GEMP01038271.1:223-1158(+)